MCLGDEDDGESDISSPSAQTHPFLCLLSLFVPHYNFVKNTLPTDEPFVLILLRVSLLALYLSISLASEEGVTTQLLSTPLLLPPLRRRQKMPSPSTPARTLAPQQSDRVRSRTPRWRARPAHPRASPCSCLRRAVCPWEEGWPCPGPGTGTPFPVQTQSYKPPRQLHTSQITTTKHQEHPSLSKFFLTSTHCAKAY